MNDIWEPISKYQLKSLSSHFLFCCSNDN